MGSNDSMDLNEAITSSKSSNGEQTQAGLGGPTYFNWIVDSESVRAKDIGELVLSPTFCCCSRKWQLCLESRGPNSPPKLSVDLITSISKSIRAVVSCCSLLEGPYLQRGFRPVCSITKQYKFYKSTTRTRRLLGSIIGNFDNIECKIDATYLKSKSSSGFMNITRQTRSIARPCLLESNSEKRSDTLDEHADNPMTNSSNPAPRRVSHPIASDLQQKQELTPSPMPPQDLHINPHNIVVSFEVLTRLMRGDNNLSDVTLITLGGRKFQAHKVVLSLRSQKFDETFRDNSGAHHNEIQLHDISDALFEKVYEWIYTGKISNLDINVVELYRASVAYKVHGLTDFCLQSLRERLDIQNASDILILSNQANLIDLKNHVIQFINQNIKNILHSESFQRMMKLNPVLVAELYCSLGHSM